MRLSKQGAGLVLELVEAARQGNAPTESDRDSEKAAQGWSIVYFEYTARCMLRDRAEEKIVFGSAQKPKSKSRIVGLWRK